MPAHPPKTPDFVPGLLFGLVGDGNGTAIVRRLLKAVAAAQAAEFLRSVAITGAQDDQQTHFDGLKRAKSEHALMEYLFRTASDHRTTAQIQREGWLVSSQVLVGQKDVTPRRIAPVLKAMEATGLVEVHGHRQKHYQLTLKMVGLLGQTYRIQQATMPGADRPMATANTMRILRHPAHHNILEQLLRSAEPLAVHELASERTAIVRTQGHVRLLVRNGLVIATDPRATLDNLTFSIPKSLRRPLLYLFPESDDRRKCILQVLEALSQTPRVAAINALREDRGVPRRVPRVKTTGNLANAVGGTRQTLIHHLRHLAAAGVVEAAGGSQVTGGVRWQLRHGENSTAQLAVELLDTMEPCVNAVLATTAPPNPWEGLGRFFQALHNPQARWLVWNVLDTGANSVEELSHSLGVTKQTVVRQLSDLASAGVLRRPAYSRAIPSPPRGLPELMRDISRLDELLEPYAPLIARHSMRTASLGARPAPGTMRSFPGREVR